MPISDVVRSEKFISAAEAVEMVMDRLGCAQSEASALLFRLVRGGYLQLWWTNKSPDQNSGKALCLAGEERVLVPGFPQAWAVDELDWSAGELRRRLRIPMLDMARLTPDERLAFDDPWKPRERGSAEQRYPFRIKRAQLVAILNAVPTHLADAAGILRQAPLRRREPASAGTVAPASGWAAPIGGDRARKPDPRNKSKAMLDGLERALASGALIEGQPATLKAAYDAMLEALNRKSPPRGMSVDAFAKHCKQWLREHGIYE